MKIGILSQPLLNNYGGLLQNYALQTVLKRLGNEVYTINIKNKKLSYFHKFASILIRIPSKVLGKDVRLRSWPTTNESQIISHYTNQFVTKNISTTEIFTKKLDQCSLCDYKFDAYIVGSDQVWRPKYSPQLPTYFLDFVDNNFNVKKLAYAASFGVDSWEFSKKQTTEIKRLINLFDAISVREDSGVDLCKKNFDIQATHVLDPTLLLNKEEYITLVHKENIEESSGNLFTYILDSNDEKKRVVREIAQKYQLNPFSVMQPKRFSEVNRNGIDDCIFPPVEKWIRGFMDAKFVITDSFHGTVFSIIFNKPFLAIGNKKRGQSRFNSLLKLFNLEDRLIFSNEELFTDNFKDINWKRINNILEREVKESMDFIKSSLSI